MPDVESRQLDPFDFGSSGNKIVTQADSRVGAPVQTHQVGSTPTDVLADGKYGETREKPDDLTALGRSHAPGDLGDHNRAGRKPSRLTTRALQPLVCRRHTSKMGDENVAVDEDHRRLIRARWRARSSGPRLKKSPSSRSTPNESLIAARSSARFSAGPGPTAASTRRRTSSAREIPRARERSPSRVTCASSR